MEKILICSTEEGIREAMKAILSDHHELIVTSSLEQSLEVIKNTEIRLFLLDIDKQEGFESAVKQVKSVHPKTKITLLANHKSQKIAEEAIKTGANGYIVKPIKADELQSICRT